MTLPHPPGHVTRAGPAGLKLAHLKLDIAPPRKLSQAGPPVARPSPLPRIVAQPS